MSKTPVWATLFLSAILCGQAACGAPDLIITAVGLPTETRWLDIIMWQASPMLVKQQLVESRQLIDVRSRGDASVYRVGLLDLNREPTYAIFIAAFKDDTKGVPCLLNTTQAIQDPGWSLVGDILVPFFEEIALPKTGCFAPQGAKADWPTQMPFIASVSLATTAFDNQGSTKDIPAFSMRGWNFMLDDKTDVVFTLPPTPAPTVKSKLLNPTSIEWSVQQTMNDRLTVQDITVERADKSTRHTITLGIELPKPQQ